MFLVECYWTSDGDWKCCCELSLQRSIHDHTQDLPSITSIDGSETVMLMHGEDIHCQFSARFGVGSDTIGKVSGFFTQKSEAGKQ